MKKFFKYAFVYISALMLSMGFASCSDSDSNSDSDPDIDSGTGTTTGLTDDEKAQLISAAGTVQTALADALEAIANMKAPFVLYYSDASAGEAMDALDDLENALDALDALLADYGSDLEDLFQTTNSNYVELTIKKTYRALADNSKELMEALSGDLTKDAVDEACEWWFEARRDWEYSEAFLFGPAGDYAIDPHIDTWPFNATTFEAYMKKYDPVNDEDDAEILAEAIALGQNLTGFHAVEYLLFRDGKNRTYTDITENEWWFAKTAAEDLYLSALKLVSAWGGDISDDEQDILDEAEFESKDYGEDFVNAGQAGSGYSAIILATRQIIAGCNDIIGEVRDSKIGAPHTGEDTNYIESPHAYNSIQDFYDNIISCQHALYGGYGASSPTSTSLIGVCLSN